MTSMIKTNGIKVWLLAARPKTLTGALAPVIVGLSAAWADKGSLLWLPAVLCALFALLMQIDSNFINDYLDYRNGTDGEERLGPERACAQGWITPRAMQWGIGIITLLACLIGLPLIIWGGWAMVIVGVACVVGSFLYSLLFARIALGDLLVLLFFGIVPVCVTYYLQTGTDTVEIMLASLAMGMVTDCLLIVNNYRDRNTDRLAGKRTLVTLIGERATEWLYLLMGLVAFLFCLPQSYFLVLFLPFHVYNWYRMKTIHEGRALNAILGRAASNIFIFALLYSIGVIWGI